MCGPWVTAHEFLMGMVVITRLQPNMLCDKQGFLQKTWLPPCNVDR